MKEIFEYFFLTNCIHALNGTLRIIADQLNIQVLHKLVTYSEPSYHIQTLYLVHYNMLDSLIGKIFPMDCSNATVICL